MKCVVELETVQHIAVTFVKEQKKVDEVLLIATEHKNGVWIVRGTCPLDLGGHPWRESFEITVDRKGKIKASRFKLM